MKSIALVLLLTTAFLTACSTASPDPTVIIPTIIELPTSTVAATASPIVSLTTCRLFNWWSEHYATISEYLDAFADAYADSDQRVAITLQLNDSRYFPDRGIEPCSVEAARYWAIGAELLVIALRLQIEQGSAPLLWGGAPLTDAAVAEAFATTTAQMATLEVEWTAAAFQTSEVARHGTATALLAPLATRDAVMSATLTASAGR